MQDCFRQHPEMYGSELADDEDEVEEELRADAAAEEAERPAESAPSAETAASQAVKSSPQNEAWKPELAKNISISPVRTGEMATKGTS
jgi:intermembrane space import and assembly protein 40